MQRRVACCVALGLVTALFVGGASAQDSDRKGPSEEESFELDRAAHGLFQAGSVAFEHGRYEDALQHFLRAYELSPRHLLLFNIASTYDRLRRDDEALATFKKYLSLVPEVSNRRAVEARIRLLERAIQRRDAEEEKRRAEEQQAEERAAQPPQQAAVAEPETVPEAAPEPEPEPVPVPKPEEEKAGLSPVYVGIGAALTVVGAGLSVWSGLNTLKARDQYEDFAGGFDEPSTEAAAASKELYDDGVSRQNRTNVLFIATGVLAVGTGVLAVFTDWSFLSGDTRTTAWADPQGGGLEVRHAF